MSMSTNNNNNAINGGAIVSNETNANNLGALQVSIPDNTGLVTYNQGATSHASSSLYVGDLHPDISEAQIFDKFSSVGTVISIRVCRDMVSRKSLGYAYVNFSQRADAEKAIEMFNFDELKGRQMRLMWSQRDPSVRKSGVGNIFIKNLEKDIKMRELYDTVSAFGVILSCKIANDEAGCSKGYGFVHFEKECDAENAIKSLHGMMIFDKKLFVCKFRPSSERMAGIDEPKFNNVFVKNFGEDMTDDKLRELFVPFGEILSLKVEVGEDNQSKGFGFVCYKDCESATKAVEEMNQKEIDGRMFYVGRALKKNERLEILRKNIEKKKQDRATKFAPGVNLYVKNLDDSVTDEVLKKEFASFGAITSAKVMVDSEHGRSKGFGFVCFQFAEEATRAVTEMSGKYVGSKPLYVALAQRKDERRQQLASQYVQRQINRTAYTGNPQGTFPGMPNQMYNQNFNNQPLAFALNRPTFMNGIPPMGAPRPRFQQPTMGQMPQMRPAMGGGNPSQMMNQMQHRPTVAQMRALNSAAAAGQFNQNLMAMNPNLRPQAGPGMAMQQRQPNIGTNTRLTRPPGMQQYRSVLPMGNQMRMPPSLVMPQSIQQQQQQGGGLVAPPNPEMDDNIVLQNLDNLDEESKRQILGETLFKHVSKIAPPEMCSKITGMLIERNLNDVRSMIEQHLQNPNGSRLGQHVATALVMVENQRGGTGDGSKGGPSNGV